MSSEQQRGGRGKMKYALRFQCLLYVCVLVLPDGGNSWCRAPYGNTQRNVT